MRWKILFLSFTVFLSFDSSSVAHSFSSLSLFALSFFHFHFAIRNVKSAIYRVLISICGTINDAFRSFLFSVHWFGNDSWLIFTIHKTYIFTNQSQWQWMMMLCIWKYAIHATNIKEKKWKNVLAQFSILLAVSHSQKLRIFCVGSVAHSFSDEWLFMINDIFFFDEKQRRSWTNKKHQIMNEKNSSERLHLALHSWANNLTSMANFKPWKMRIHFKIDNRHCSGRKKNRAYRSWMFVYNA